MFGISQIARRARHWHASRKRAALHSMLSGLPLEIQKDIGWPAPHELGSAHSARGAIHTRPKL